MEIKLFSSIPQKICAFIVSNFNIYNNNNNYSLEFFNNNYYKYNTMSAAIIFENKIYASCVLKFFPDQNGPWLSYFIVDQQLKRKTFGTQLLNKLKDIFPFIGLECWTENKEALIFYKFNQFNEIYQKNNSIFLSWKQIKMR